MEDVVLDRDEQTDAVGLFTQWLVGQDTEPDPDRWCLKWSDRTSGGHPIVQLVYRPGSTPKLSSRRKTRSQRRDGYKASRIAADPDTGIITACDVTSANAPDGAIGVKMPVKTKTRVGQIIADSAYGSAAHPPPDRSRRPSHHYQTPVPNTVHPRLGKDNSSGPRRNCRCHRSPPPAGDLPGRVAPPPVNTQLLITGPFRPRRGLLRLNPIRVRCPPPTAKVTHPGQNPRPHAHNYLIKARRRFEQSSLKP